MTAEQASVVKRLRTYLQRIDELMRMLEVGPLPLAGDAKATARAKLKSLKGDMRREYRRMSTRRGELALTETEKSCYVSVIHQSYAELDVATNSIPDQKWYSELYGVRINFTHMLGQFRHISDRTAAKV